MKDVLAKLRSVFEDVLKEDPPKEPAPEANEARTTVRRVRKAKRMRRKSGYR